MGEDQPGPKPDARALMTQAQAGGAGAALAAKRAALLAERDDPALAREALALAARLEPLDPSPRLALARLHAETGRMQAARTEAAAVLAEAVDQAARARAAFMLGEIARFNQDRAAARTHYGQALAIEEALLAADRTDPSAARWYARARGRLAELDAADGASVRALAGAEGALAMLRATAAQIGETPVLAADIADAEMRLGAMEVDTGRPTSARRRLGEAIARYEALAVTERDEPHWPAVLSDSWALAAEADLARGAAEAARQAMDKALQARLRLAARHPEETWALAGTWRLRGALRDALGDADAAADSFAQARALAERLSAQAPQAEAPARFLVHTLLDQADHALRTQRPQEAREAADAARARAEEFGARRRHAAWFGQCAACWDRLGEAARALDADTQAYDAFVRAVEFRRLARERDGDDDLRLTRALAAALVKFGEAAMETGAAATARAAFGESVTLRLRLLDRTPDDGRAAHALAAALERFGLAAIETGDAAAARTAWEDELALADRIFSEDSLEGARFRAIVASHLVQLGGPDAAERRTEALAQFDRLAQAGVLSEREAALRKKLWNG